MSPLSGFIHKDLHLEMRWVQIAQVSLQKSQAAIKGFIARENCSAQMSCNHTGKQRTDLCYNTILSANFSVLNSVTVEVNIRVSGVAVALNCWAFQTYLALWQNLRLDEKKPP